MDPKVGQQHLAKNGESAEGGHACDHVSEQQAPGAQNAGDGPQTFDNVSIERTRRSGAPSELIDVKTNKKQSDGGEKKAKPCSVASADKDQAKNCRRNGGRTNDCNGLRND